MHSTPAHPLKLLHQRALVRQRFGPCGQLLLLSALRLLFEGLHGLIHFLTLPGSLLVFLLPSGRHLVRLLLHHGGDTHRSRSGGALMIRGPGMRRVRRSPRQRQSREWGVSNRLAGLLLPMPIEVSLSAQSRSDLNLLMAPRSDLCLSHAFVFFRCILALKRPRRGRR